MARVKDRPAGATLVPLASDGRPAPPLAQVGSGSFAFRGGHAAATIYTIVESCKKAGVDPYTYLADVLLRVATHPASRVDELLPANWKPVVSPAERERA